MKYIHGALIEKWDLFTAIWKNLCVKAKALWLKAVLTWFWHEKTLSPSVSFQRFNQKCRAWLGKLLQNVQNSALRKDCFCLFNGNSFINSICSEIFFTRFKFSVKIFTIRYEKIRLWRNLRARLYHTSFFFVRKTWSRPRELEDLKIDFWRQHLRERKNLSFTFFKKFIKCRN